MIGSNGFINRSFPTLECCLKAARREMRAAHTDELPGNAPKEYRGDTECDDAGPADLTADPCHLQCTP